MLRDLQVGGVEERRRPLDLGQLAACGPVQQPRRRVETAAVQEDLVTMRVGGHDGGAGVLRQTRHGVRVPGARGEHLDPAGHVGEGDHHQPVPRPRVVVQAGVRVGSEHHMQSRCAGEEFVVVRGEQRAGPVLLDTGLEAVVPIGAQLDEEPAAVDGDARVGGGVDPDQFVTAKLVDLFVEEVERPADDGALEAGRAVHRCRDDDVVGGPGEHRFGLLEWLVPPPPLDDARVARCGERPLAEVGADEQRVLVRPRGL